jgi:hypothetical protein
MTREGVIGMLYALPRLLPDPRWQEQAKRRLLDTYDLWYSGMKALRHWALYVSTKPEVSPVADAIVARGSTWRPVTVAPERISDAVRAIHPVLVVIDEQLPESGRLLEEMKRTAAVTVVTDRELVDRDAA